MQQIDYSSLGSDKQRQDADRASGFYASHFSAPFIKQWLSKHALLLLLLSPVIVIGLIALFFVLLFFGAFLFIGLFIAAIGVFLYLYYKQNKGLSKDPVGDFARSNGWQVGGPVPAISMIRQSNMLNQQSQAIMQGTLDGFGFSVYSGEPALQYGKFSQGAAQQAMGTVLSLDVQTAVPSLLIMPSSLVSNFEANAIENATGLQHLQLEGNFDQYARLYVAPNQQQAALEFITPDVMQTLMDTNLSLSAILYSDHYVSVLTNINAFDYLAAHALFTVAQVLTKELAEKLHNDIL